MATAPFALDTNAVGTVCLFVCLESKPTPTMKQVITLLGKYCFHILQNANETKFQKEFRTPNLQLTYLIQCKTKQQKPRQIKYNNIILNIQYITIYSLPNVNRRKCPLYNRPQIKNIAFVKSKQFKLITEVCINNPSTCTWEAEAGELEVWELSWVT